MSKEDALKEAKKRSRKSIENKLNNDEYIIEEILLDKNFSQNKVTVKIFYKVYENLVEYKEIQEENIEIEGVEELY